MRYPFLKARKLEQTLQKASCLVTLDVDAETVQLLQTARQLTSLSKLPVPAPVRHRRYLAVSAEHAQTTHRLLNWAGMLGGATLAMGLLLTVIFAANSKPGSPLSYYKHQGQSLRLRFTINESDRANLQIKYTVDRIEATQNLLQDDRSSAEEKVAALSELATQTQVTVEQVKTVALAQNNSELLNKLEGLTQKQSDVLAATSDPAVKEAANSALKSTEANSKSIAVAKRLVAAANESTVASLPAPVTITGTIVKVAVDSITVDKTIVLFSEKMGAVTDTKNSVDKSVFKVGQQVSVTGSKTEAGITAQAITITAQPAVKKVKGTVTGDISDVAPDPVVEPEPTPIQSGFQVEDPAPQYLTPTP